MEFLTDNPLANMRGPDFLIFYAAVAGVAILTLIVLAAREASGDNRPLPPVPARPDPYELAYLRDGPGGVVWLAIYALKRASLVDLAKGKLQRLSNAATPGDKYEMAVWNAIGAGCAPSAIIRDRAPGGSVASLMSALEARLAMRGLVRDAASRSRATRAMFWIGAALFALAAYKAIIAIERGHRNVGGLFAEFVVACMILAIVANAFFLRRASRLGQAYLSRTRLAYEQPRQAARTAGACDDTAAMLLVGVYGFQVLTGGPEDAFAKQARTAQSSGGCGGGSCSSGGGGGCGGGGGGGCGGCSS